MKEPDQIPQPPEPADDFWDNPDEAEFIPCPLCDGHPACEDFGCAFELGCGHLVNKEPGNDF